jgi:isoamylase
MLAGDEFARTQGGNNNAYCQDNEISWVDWHLREKHEAQVQFLRKLTSLRHRYPILRRNLFLNGQYFEDLGVRDVTWINPNGSQMELKDWEDPALRSFGILLDGRAPSTGVRQKGQESTIFIVVNGGADITDFTLPEAAGGTGWSLLIDTNLSEVEGTPRFAIGGRYAVTARSLLVFVLEDEPAKEDG